MAISGLNGPDVLDDAHANCKAFLANESLWEIAGRRDQHDDVWAFVAE
jgi:hypothetical protein